MGFQLPVVPLPALEGKDRPDFAAEFHVQAVKKEEMRHTHHDDGQRAQALAEDRGVPAQPEQDQARRREDQRSRQYDDRLLRESHLVHIVWPCRRGWGSQDWQAIVRADAAVFFAGRRL